MVTLDEAIAKAERLAEKHETDDFGTEQAMLAYWLREYRELLCREPRISPSATIGDYSEGQWEYRHDGD